jgi:UDP-glucose 4-epimerase
VKQVLQSVERVAGRSFDIRQAPRRLGDPATVVSDPTRAKAVLGWQPSYDNLDTIVGHALAWEAHLSQRNA